MHACAPDREEFIAMYAQLARIVRAINARIIHASVIYTQPLSLALSLCEQPKLAMANDEYRPPRDQYIHPHYKRRHRRPRGRPTPTIVQCTNSPNVYSVLGRPHAATTTRRALAHHASTAHKQYTAPTELQRPTTDGQRNLSDASRATGRCLIKQQVGSRIGCTDFYSNSAPPQRERERTAHLLCTVINLCAHARSECEILMVSVRQRDRIHPNRSRVHRVPLIRPTAAVAGAVVVVLIRSAYIIRGKYSMFDL